MPAPRSNAASSFRRITTATAAVLLAAVLSAACATKRDLYIPGPGAAQAAQAEASQTVADTYRRAGAPEAAKPAQARADAAAAAAKSPNPIGWLIDLFFALVLF